MTMDRKEPKGVLVALITLHNSPNYGSCLQTYAAQETLKGLGCKVEVIDYYRHDAIPKNEVDRALSGQLSKSVPGLDNQMIKAIAKLPVAYLVKERAKPLTAFKKEYLDLSSIPYYSFEDLKSKPPFADVYCTGSDQVWNSDWNGGFEKAFYLEFAPEGAKKISYAASIGKENLDESEIEQMATALSAYEAISVREQTAVGLLSNIGIQNVAQVIDPTLMLDASDWMKIASGRTPDKPYVLLYQLNENNELFRYAKKISVQYGTPLYRIAYGSHERLKGGNVIVCPSVEQFLLLFANAKYVITDSFHGTVFATLFSKKFVSVSPSRFGSRISDYLTLIDEKAHLLEDFNNTDSIDVNIDYIKVNSRLLIKRQEALSFLQKAILTQG